MSKRDEQRVRDLARKQMARDSKTGRNNQLAKQINRRLTSKK